MNYAAHYSHLIARARGRVLVGYRERHHVLPSCMGGGNEPENLVALTAEEHYVAHQLLVRIHPDIPGLVHAAVWMAKQCTGNKAYGWLRQRHALAVSAARLGKQFSKEHLANMSAARRGRVLSPEHRANMSATLRGRALSPETRAKISTARIGRVFSPEHRAKLSAANIGRKHSAETRAKMSAAIKAHWAQRRAA